MVLLRLVRNHQRSGTRWRFRLPHYHPRPFFFRTRILRWALSKCLLRRHILPWFPWWRLVGSPSRHSSSQSLDPGECAFQTKLVNCDLPWSAWCLGSLLQEDITGCFGRKDRLWLFLSFLVDKISFFFLIQLLGCTSIGTFLSVLGIDLLVHQQSGMSRGLRCLFDGNQVHYQDLIGSRYDPSLASIILIVFSLCAVPALAFAQGYVFKLPFNRKNIERDEEGDRVMSSAELKSSSQTLTALPVKKMAST